MVISCNSKRPIIGLVNEFIFLVRNYPTEVLRVNDSDFLPDNFRLTQIGDSRNTSKYSGCPTGDSDCVNDTTVEFPQFIMEIKSGVILSSSHDIFDKNNGHRIRTRLFDFSYNDNWGESRFRSPYFLAGRTLLPCSSNSASFYHCVAEFLSKLIVCHDLNRLDYDQIVIHGVQREVELLDALEFKGKIIKLQELGRPALWCESLNIPSAFHEDLYIPRYITRKINYYFLNSARFESFQRSHRILILRRGSRRFSNEKRLVLAMKCLNFTPLYLEDYSLPQTVSLFRSAEIVVGAHGAGLTNIIFCESAKLVEIGLGQSSILFPVLAAQLGFPHFLYVGDYHEESQTLSFDIDDFIRCLLAAEIFD